MTEVPTMIRAGRLSPSSQFRALLCAGFIKSFKFTPAGVHRGRDAALQASQGITLETEVIAPFTKNSTNKLSYEPCSEQTTGEEQWGGQGLTVCSSSGQHS